MKNNEQEYIDTCFKIFFDDKNDFAYYCTKAKSLWFDISKNSLIVSASIENLESFISQFKEGINLFDRISKFMKTLNHKRINLYRHIYHWTTLKRIKIECEEETIKNICSQQSKIKPLLNNKAFKKYSRWFDINFFRYTNHFLDDKTKKLLGEMSYGDLIEKIYRAMIDYDIKPKYLNTLTFQERNDLYSLKCTDKAYETVRKLVWLDLSNEFFLHADTITSLLFNRINFYNLIANHKSFNNVIEENIYSYELNKNLFNTLSKSSQIFKECNIRFKEIEKALSIGYYNLNSFEPWDINLEIFKSKINVTDKEFKKCILGAFKHLGNEYSQNLIRLLNNPIINISNDISNVYIETLDGKSHNMSLPNDGTIQCLFKAAHCIGHCINDYFLKINNKQPNILNSEIASMVNETLMFLYLKDNFLLKDQFELCNAYYFFLKQTINIVSLSNMRLVLKQELNNLLQRSKGTDSINYEETNKLFNRVKKHYEGLIDDEFRWIDDKNLSKLVNIGLLQQIFEQYHLIDDVKYVVGLIVALDIGFKIYDGDIETIQKFHDFLKSGIELDPIESIKNLGINLLDNEFYYSIEKRLSNLIAEFKHKLIGTK